MKLSLTLVAASVASLLAADMAMAAPPSHGNAWGHSSQNGRGNGNDRHGGSQSTDHYYNGRWVNDTEWRRHSHEQDRWATSYRYRHGGGDNSSALLGGIVGFALGAAIVGSQEQADHARTAGQSWDSYCAKKYRSYDRSSRTYLGYDGARHYCQ